MADRFRLIAAVLVFVLGIAAFYYLDNQPDFVRALIVIGAALVGAAIGYQTEPGKRLWEFARAARAELRKVVWPSNKETMQVTLVVFGMVVLIAVFLWFVDWGLLKIMQALTGQRA